MGVWLDLAGLGWTGLDWVGLRMTQGWARMGADWSVGTLEGKHRTPIRNRDFADSTSNIQH